jgi:hypothetical protein
MALTPQETAQQQQALAVISGFFPSNWAPYVQAVAVDGPLAFLAFEQIKEAIAKLPAGTNFMQAVEAFGVPTGTPAHTVCELIDLVVAQTKASPAVTA